MRILHLIDHLGLGGAQTALAELVNHWPAKADQLHVVALGSRVDLLPRFPSDPRRRVESLGSRRWDISCLRRIARLVRRHDYDIMHAHLCKSVLAALWTKRPSNTRLVIHLHGDPRHDFSVLRWALRWGWPRADAIIAVSQHTHAAARRFLRVPDERMHQIYNPLSGLDSGVVPRSPEAQRIRRDLDVGPNTLLLGFVGRLVAVKGLDVLLRALRQIRELREDIRLAIVGNGPLAGQLQQQARRLDVHDLVHFAGAQSDVASWFGAFDIAVYPSSTEGLPAAVVEAMRSGVPVVASHVGGIPEVIQDGLTGRLVPPGDADTLARTILALAEAPEQRCHLATTARRVAGIRFAPDRVGRQVRQLYGRLLDPRVLDPS